MPDALAALLAVNTTNFPAALRTTHDTAVAQARSRESVAYNVYVSKVDPGQLAGASTTLPDGELVDVLALLESSGYQILAPVGSALDQALSGFPALLNKGVSLVPVESSPVALPGTSGVVRTGTGEYLGYTARETSGSSRATIILYDNGTAATGLILEEISLSPGESVSDHYPRPGRLYANGVFAAITGTVEGSVFF